MSLGLIGKMAAHFIISMNTVECIRLSWILSIQKSDSLHTMLFAYLVAGKCAYSGALLVTLLNTIFHCRFLPLKTLIITACSMVYMQTTHIFSRFSLVSWFICQWLFCWKELSQRNECHSATHDTMQWVWALYLAVLLASGAGLCQASHYPLIPICFSGKKTE